MGTPEQCFKIFTQYIFVNHQKRIFSFLTFHAHYVDKFFEILICSYHPVTFRQVFQLQ